MIFRVLWIFIKVSKIELYIFVYIFKVVEMGLINELLVNIIYCKYLKCVSKENI